MANDGMSANLDSCFVVTSAALPMMQAGSRFVFVSSSAAHEPMPGRTAYSAAKAGMNAFAEPWPSKSTVTASTSTSSRRAGGNGDAQDVPFEMYAVTAKDVAETVAWLDTVAASVDLPEIRLNAVTRGPSARQPIVPLEVQRGPEQGIGRHDESRPRSRGRRRSPVRPPGQLSR